MKEERLKILEMLDGGKISVDEAERLLGLCKKEQHGHHHIEFDSNDFEEKAREFSKNAEKFAKDARDKAFVFYKDVEPRLKKGAQIVIEKTALVADEISRVLNDALKNLAKEAEDCCCCCPEEEDPCCCGDAPADNGPRPEETE